jgi:hypothetical protein
MIKMLGIMHGWWWCSWQVLLQKQYQSYCASFKPTFSSTLLLSMGYLAKKPVAPILCSVCKIKSSEGMQLIDQYTKVRWHPRDTSEPCLPSSVHNCYFTKQLVATTLYNLPSSPHYSYFSTMSLYLSAGIESALRSAGNSFVTWSLSW